MAKLTRERSLIEKRARKQEKTAARKQAAEEAKAPPVEDEASAADEAPAD